MGALVAADREIRFGRYRLHPAQGLFRGHQVVHVTPKSLALLHALAARAGEVVTKDELFQQVWPHAVVTEASLATCIQELRTALHDDARKPRFIETVHRRGYRFVADIAQLPDRVDDHAQPAAVELRTTEPAETKPAIEPRALPAKDRVSWRRPGLVPLATVAVALGVAALLAYDGFTRWRAGREVTRPAAVPSPATTELPARTVAVLRFENLSADARDAYVAFGLAESVLHRLASIPDLTLIARTSSFALGDRQADAQQIGRLLNARYLVEGSVQRSGERLRATAQLIDATTGGHLWSLRFDRTIDDIFAVEDEISESIATALDVSLNREQHPYASFGTDAYLAYLQGRALLATSRVQDAERAIEHFKRATEIAPKFAAAYAALADAHWQIALLQQTGGTGFLHRVRTDRQHEMMVAGVRKAQPLVDRALQLDDTLGEAYILRADLKTIMEDLDGAKDDYRKGLALSPSNAAGHEGLALLFWNFGPDGEGVAEIDRAIRVDPLSPRNYFVLGYMHFQNETGGVFTEAEQNFQKALALAPDYHPALLRLGVIRWNQGRFAEAVALGERALTLDPRADWARRPLAEMYLEVGEVAAARNVLLEAPETVPPVQWSAICLYEQQPARGIDLRRAEEPGFEAIFDADVEVYLLRDAALASRRLGWGRAELLALDRGPAEENPWAAAALAQLSVAQGERQEAERLARKLLELERASSYFYGHQVAYPRAAAHTVLAQNGAALDLLEKGFASGYRKRWWYAFHRDPALESLRREPRFQALAAKAEAHAAAERESIRQMRERGQLPKRTVNKASNAGRC